MSETPTNLKNQLISIKLAEKRLLVLEHQLDDALHELESLNKIVEKEFRDIQLMEKTSSFMIFKKILDNKDEKLQKEKEEYLHAVLKYDSTLHKIKIITYEKELLIKKISTKQSVLEKLEKIISTHDGTTDITSKHPLYDGIKRLNSELERMHQVIVEIDEAKEAAKNLIKYLATALKNLDGFDNVNQSGMQIFYYDQLTYLKNIRQVFAIIDHLELQLNKELKDINVSLKSKNEYTPYKSFFEQMLHVAVIGYVSNTHLRRSKLCITQNIKNTHEIIAHLDQLANECDMKIKLLQQEKIVYLENI
jgi:hypothetical protein